MLFEATWMDQEIVILNEFSERGSQITYDIQNLKYETNEHIQNRNIITDIGKKYIQLPKVKGTRRKKLGV